MSCPPFVDTHVHFWDLRNPRLVYDWLAPRAELPWFGDHSAMKSTRYLPTDFRAETRFRNIGKVVHVDAALGSVGIDSVEETRWLQELASHGDGTPQGIVAHVCLAAETVQEELELHLDASENMRGIRDVSAGPHWGDEKWQRGYALLEKYSLVYCHYESLSEIDEAVDLIQRTPGVVHCVDHTGFPRERTKECFDEWRGKMRRLAELDNTVVKISGLGMADHLWTSDSLKPWVSECIEAWGCNRAVFGTNWPLDRLHSSYVDIIDAYDSLTAEFSESEREALFHGNAERVFRL